MAINVQEPSRLYSAMLGIGEMNVPVSELNSGPTTTCRVCTPEIVLALGMGGGVHI